MESVPVHSIESETTTGFPNTKNLHKRNAKGETLLHLACRRQDVAQVKALIKAGLDVNTPDFAGWTALHEAALSGDRVVVGELLRAGARVNARSMNGDTALHDAVSSENYQVVKLLLEHGSNPQDKNVGGLCALDMAESSDIRELLQAFHQSAPGSLCLEARVPPRASSDCSENVGQFQTSAQIQDSKGLALVLSEVEVKQAELRSCSVRGPEEAGKYLSALRDIHSMLSQVLAKQHMEKDSLDHKYWSVPDCLRKRILKSQLISLASVQKKLVDVLQKQMEVVDELGILKSEPSSQPRNNEQTQSSKCPATAPPRVQSSGVDTISLSAPPAPILVNKTPISLHQVTAKESTGQKSVAKIMTPRKLVTAASVTNGTTPVPTIRVISNQTTTELCTKSNQRSLLKLLHGKVMSPGHPLLFLFKGTAYSTIVESCGLLKDSKGRLHLTPEDWIKSIVGNNIPVSAAYAWDKVTYRDRPLSHRWLQMEQTQAGGGEEEEEQLFTSSAPDTPTGVPDGLSLLMKIKLVRVVGDDELVPNALMDRFWEELIKEDNWTL